MSTYYISKIWICVLPHDVSKSVAVDWSPLTALLRTFGFSAISTYNSYLPSNFGTNALI